MTRKQLLMYLLAFVVRIAFCLYAEYHDASFEVKYTDVDYKVFTDGARHVLEGRFPYECETYRYTPLVAYIMTPNILYHPMCGKILLCIADVIAGWLIYVLVSFDKNSRGTNAAVSAAAWLFNPFTVAISSRGSFEPIQCCLVHLSLWLALKRKYLLCGLIWGFSVHMKMYTVIYGPAFYIWANIYTSRSSIKDMVVPNASRIRLVLGSVLGFGLPTGYFYWLYGFKFIYETFLYHITREDTQHNFSPMFYPLRLLSENPSEGSEMVKMMLSLAATLTQFILVIRGAFRYAAYHLPFALFTQICWFVIFNKVATSQYFTWYLCLLPLIVHRLPFSVTAWFFVFLSWMTPQLLWLFQAYHFEIKHRDNLFYVFVAGIIYVVSHSVLLLLITYRFDFKASLDVRKKRK